jgi:hypothetical protein
MISDDSLVSTCQSMRRSLYESGRKGTGDDSIQLTTEIY